MPGHSIFQLLMSEVLASFSTALSYSIASASVNPSSLLLKFVQNPSTSHYLPCCHPCSGPRITATASLQMSCVCRHPPTVRWSFQDLSQIVSLLSLKPSGGWPVPPGRSEILAVSSEEGPLASGPGSQLLACLPVPPSSHLVGILWITPPFLTLGCLRAFAPGVLDAL